MIHLNQLTKFYRTDEMETTALNQINLRIKQGESAAIMGPSGSGKSTLLNIIGLLDEIDAGTYEFNSEDVSHINESERTKIRKSSIGFIFQNFNLIDDLTVYENVELPLIYDDIPTNERQDRVHEILKKFGMEHRKNHFPLQLSGGQQQRAAISRALITEPKLILADEPTGNLDSENSIQVMEMIQNLNQEGTTLLIVTHSEEDAAYCKAIYHMLDGKLFENKTALEASH